MDKKISLSLIVPAYRPRAKLEDDIKTKWQVLNKSFTNKFELIYIIEGFADSVEKRNIKKGDRFEKKYPGLKIYGYEKNMGKGYGVRFGMKKAVGNFIGFMDFNSEIESSEMEKTFNNSIKSNFSVITSRFLNGSSYNISPFRKLLSRFSFLMIKLILGLNVTDSQSGLKVFTREAAQKILKYSKVNRWVFDAEFLYILKLFNLPVVERPVKFIRGAENASSVKLKSYFRSLIDLFEIRFRLKNLNNGAGVAEQN